MAAYDITNIAELEHDTVLGTYNALVKIDDTHFILAYSGAADDGFIKTFSINGSYEWTQLDSLEFNTSLARSCALLKIDATHFILAYFVSGDVIRLATFSIDGSYNITQIDEHDLDVAGNQVAKLGLLQLDATHFVLSFTRSNFSTFPARAALITIVIDGSYIIDDLNNILIHDAAEAADSSSLVLLDSTHFMLAYGDFQFGALKTFSFDGSYTMTQIDEYQFNSTLGSTYVSLIEMTNGTFVVGYSAFSNAAGSILKTFTVDGSYVITEEDSRTFASAGHSSVVVAINDDHVLYVYANTTGYAASVLIDGTTIEPPIDEYQYTAGVGRWPSMVQIDDDHFAVAFAGVDFDGFIATLKVELGGGFTASPLIHQMAQVGGLM